MERPSSIVILKIVSSFSKEEKRKSPDELLKIVN